MKYLSDTKLFAEQIDTNWICWDPHPFDFPGRLFALPLCPDASALVQHNHITQQPRPSFFPTFHPPELQMQLATATPQSTLQLDPIYHHTIPLSRPLQMLLSTTPPKRSLLQPVSTATSQRPLSITTQFETATATLYCYTATTAASILHQTTIATSTVGPYIGTIAFCTLCSYTATAVIFFHATDVNEHCLRFDTTPQPLHIPLLCNHTQQSRRATLSTTTTATCLFPIHQRPMSLPLALHALFLITTLLQQQLFPSTLTGGVRFCSVSPVTDHFVFAPKCT